MSASHTGSPRHASHAGSRGLRRLLILVAIAILTHLLAVWALPRVIMHRLMHGPLAQSIGLKAGPAFPSLADASSRRVVLPSPDLLYALCLYDVRQGPMRIQADPGAQRYWSVALYSAGSDNFHVVGDRQLGAAPLDLRLVAKPSAVPAPGVREVLAPTPQGLVLMRLLVADPTRDLPRLEAARRSLRCLPETPAG